MTLKTHLQFGDIMSKNFNRDYLVVSYHGGFSRVYNGFNPQTGAKCSDLYVTIIAPGKDDLSLYEWFIENSTLSGRLHFEIMDIHSDSGTLDRSIVFEDAQCVSIKETYDIQRPKRRQLTICFTPAKIKVEDSDFLREESDKKDGDESSDDDVDMDKYNSQYDY